ncbi:MAG TPA: hypothetical protein VE934_13490 [Polaromonas sp.]|uniref:hypothetical protein n=1 Tax=Polaromonas sp. TaxID=1869339 RepID=UPI002D732364|nr:hypothetical protein [Polaromonas sp.]HYW57973.1 hypothetical protein [Polaromonas sp.]
MTRLQISDNFGNERLQTQARPIATTTVTQAAPPPLAEDKWRGLANVFAGAEMVNENNRAMHEAQDKERASKYANSMTVDELGKRIKAGDMLASESPVFAATVQHIWGQNSQAAIERDVMTKVTTGELKFKDPTEIDNYLTENRNTVLSGQSQYASAGFDKGYANLRTNLMANVAKVNDKAIVERAVNEASDSLSNKLLEVTSGDFKGTPQEAAGALLAHYDVLRRTKVMPDAGGKAALTEVITRAAASGKTGLLASLLDTELPAVGTVRSFLGETKAATLTAQAGSQFDQGQRQRIDEEVLPFMQQSDSGTLNVDKFMAWAQSDANKKYTSASMIHSITRANMAAQAQQYKELQKAQIQGAVLASEHEAMKRVDAAMTNGTLWTVQGTANPTVLTTSGDTKDFNVKKYAEDSLTRRTQGMPFDQQVSAWAMNGLANPDWENQMKAGLFNLSSIGVDSKGKPTGELNEAGTKAIELFKQLDGTNPDYAKQVAGDTAYKRFSDIAFLTHLGRAPADAASIASNVASGAISGGSGDKIAKQVASEVGKLTDTPWLDWLANTRDHVSDFVVNNNPRTYARAFASGVLGEVPGMEDAAAWLKPTKANTAMRGTTPNTSQVHGLVKRYATLLAHSGQVGDATEALRVAVDYIRRPEVSTQVNGTLYLRSELPASPNASRTQGEWLERFIDAVPKARAKDLKFPGEAVRLEYDERSRIYRAFVAGVPLTDAGGGIMAWHKGQIQQWYSTQAHIDLIEGAAKGAEVSRKAQQGATLGAPHDPQKEAFVGEMSTRQTKAATPQAGAFPSSLNRAN